MLCSYELATLTSFFLVWACSASDTVLVVIDNNTFKSSEASFAPQVKGSGVSGFITFGNPFDACSSLESASTSQLATSMFLLTVRGNCSFEAKVRYAQAANFSAVIIYNNESGSDLLTMSGSSEGISIHAVFVTLKTGEVLSAYGDNSSYQAWIVPTVENTVWSILVFSLISLIAVGAIITAWYIVKKHRERRVGGRFIRHDEPCVMSLRIVQAMPTMTYMVGNEKAVQESCVICLEEFISGEQLRILPCSHRFHSICVDAWLTMWRAVCPICKRDARYEFPDMQVSERTPLMSFPSGRVRGFYGTKESPSSSESPPIQIPPSYPDHKMGFLDSPSSMIASGSCSRRIPSSIPGNLLFRRANALDGSLEAFRASPYFTPPSLSQHTSPLIPVSHASPFIHDGSPAIGMGPAAGSPCSYSSGPRYTWGKSFLNPAKVSRASSAAGSMSPHSGGSRTAS